VDKNKPYLTGSSYRTWMKSKLDLNILLENPSKYCLGDWSSMFEASSELFKQQNSQVAKYFN